MILKPFEVSSGEKETKKSWRISLSIAALFLLTIGSIAYAFDSVSSTITYQISTGTGSNNSKISTLTGAVSYINKGDDSSISGNYFSGYYYDSVNWFYRFNWDSSNPDENNVHVAGLTDACGNGSIGYKLEGFSRGDAGGYMNFSYDNNIFVYYCTNDARLHGFAYNINEGFQNFTGIAFDINASTTNIPIVPTIVNDQNFVNNFSRILDPNAVSNDAEKISVFYIIK